MGEKLKDAARSDELSSRELLAKFRSKLTAFGSAQYECGECERASNKKVMETYDELANVARELGDELVEMYESILRD